MRTYFQHFFKLLIPITSLFIVAAIIYFNLEYNLNQALSIGVLAGTFLGIIVSLVVSIFMPNFSAKKYSKKKKVKKIKNKVTPLEFLQTHKENREKAKGTITPKVKIKETPPEETNKNKVTPLEFLQAHKENREKNKGTTTPKVKKTPPNTTNQNKTVEYKIMLLMERDLAFEVALYAITEQNIGTLTENKSSEELIIVKNKDEVLQLAITPLTRHTSQVIVTSIENSIAAKKIMRYMKQKEYSFLKY